MKPLIWIIDEEWADYEREIEMLNEKYPEYTLKISGYDYQADLEEFGKDVDAIMAQIYTHIPKETIDKLDNCKAIAVYGGGYDRVDTQAARAKGIRVTNVSNYCKEDLADYVMAAIYHFYKETFMIAPKVKEVEWGAQAVECPPNRLTNQTLHIIGFGRIGQEVARKAIANGMKVTAYDQYQSLDISMFGAERVTWEDGLKNADFISLHCIQNEDTMDLLKYEDFCLMKPSAVFINTSRGKIPNEADLIKAVQEKKLKAAVIDVIAAEPPTYDEDIFNVENIYVTPHISYISQQSYNELKERAVKNIIMGMEDVDSPDLVN